MKASDAIPREDATRAPEWGLLLLMLGGAHDVSRPSAPACLCPRASHCGLAAEALVLLGSSAVFLPSSHCLVMPASPSWSVPCFCTQGCYQSSLPVSPDWGCLTFRWMHLRGPTPGDSFPAVEEATCSVGHGLAEPGTTCSTVPLSAGSRGASTSGKLARP